MHPLESPYHQLNPTQFQQLQQQHLVASASDGLPHGLYSQSTAHHQFPSYDYPLYPQLSVEAFQQQQLQFPGLNTNGVHVPTTACVASSSSASSNGAAAKAKSSAPANPTKSTGSSPPQSLSTQIKFELKESQNPTESSPKVSRKTPPDLTKTAATLEFPQVNPNPASSKNHHHSGAKAPTPPTAPSSAYANAISGNANGSPNQQPNSNFYYATPNSQFNSEGLVESGMGLPYCWTSSANGSISYSSSVPHGYGIGGYMPEDLNLSPIGAGISNAAQLHYDNETMGAGAYSGGWPQYCSDLPLPEKLADGSTNAMVASQISPYMNNSDRNFYTHPSFPGMPSNVDGFPTSLTGPIGPGGSELYGTPGAFTDPTTAALLHNHTQQHPDQQQHLMQHLDPLASQFTNYLPHPELSSASHENAYDMATHSSALNLGLNLMAQAPAPYAGQSAQAPGGKTKPGGKVKSSGVQGKKGGHRSTAAKRSAAATADINAVQAPLPMSATTPVVPGGSLGETSWTTTTLNTSGGSLSLSPSLSPGSKMPRKARARSTTTTMSDDDLECRSNEDKEVDRRQANNTRERIRVRDINSAFKELAKLCCQHLPNTEERGLTKLGTLLKAVELIPVLEAKVRSKNLDPRMASMKRCQQNQQDYGSGSSGSGQANNDQLQKTPIPL